ncbi:MAG: hypothetical protein EPN74_12920 [Rhodanobacter sp.]|nr:MAG: hypothetical protein EPN74_12920 [Rhodanobacter sp.]
MAPIGLDDAWLCTHQRVVANYRCVISPDESAYLSSGILPGRADPESSGSSRQAAATIRAPQKLISRSLVADAVAGKCPTMEIQVELTPR